MTKTLTPVYQVLKWNLKFSIMVFLVTSVSITASANDLCADVFSSSSNQNFIAETPLRNRLERIMMRFPPGQQPDLFRIQRVLADLPEMQLTQSYSCEGDCTYHALSKIEGYAFSSESFRKNSKAYVEERFENVESPLPGYLIIYYDKDYRMKHFGIVVDVNNGNLMIESKFGSIPGIFRHLVADVPTSYGVSYRYFRPNTGH